MWSFFFFQKNAYKHRLPCWRYFVLSWPCFCHMYCISISLVPLSHEPRYWNSSICLVSCSSLELVWPCSLKLIIYVLVVLMCNPISMAASFTLCNSVALSWILYETKTSLSAKVQPSRVAPTSKLLKSETKGFHADQWLLA